MSFAVKLCSSEKLAIKFKEESEQQRLMASLLEIYLTRGDENKRQGRSFLDGMIQKQFHRRKRQLYNYLMLPVMEVLRIADTAKTVSLTVPRCPVRCFY